jgi:hypothetical protein
MPAVLPDSELLVLLVAGSISREYLGRHKCLRAYDQTDFDLLPEFIAKSSGVIATPNTLTETSNLVSQIDESAKTYIATTFAKFANALEERYATSRRATQQSEFTRLRLTDSVLLDELANAHVLLTADARLHYAALQRGYASVNFRNLRLE